MKYNKLVRDKIPQILDAKGIMYDKWIAPLEDYRSALIKKLGEEVTEFITSTDPEELADVIEVVEALKKLPEFVGVEELRKKKFEEKGGFEQRIILIGEK